MPVNSIPIAVLAIAVTLCFCARSFGQAAGDEGPRVWVEQGLIEGRRYTIRSDDNQTETREAFGFLGVPFAAPPVGAFRFEVQLLL